MNLYEKLVEETEISRNELYSVPQLVNAIKGDISKETYKAYLIQAFHHVKHTTPMLMSMGAKLPMEKNWIRNVIAEYIEEEIGHEEWILNDIAALGGNKEEARNSKPYMSTELMVAYNYDFINRRNPVGFFGMVFMLESTSVQLATNAADTIKESLGLPKTAFTYLSSHGSLDIEHMKFFEENINKITDIKDQEDIIEVANTAFKLFADLMRSIPYDGEISHAA